MDVYLKSVHLRLDPNKSKGKGGEADIFLVRDGLVAKIFKPPDHPDLENLPLEQQAARERIAEHQRKLRAFPKGLPSKIVVPEDLITDITGQTIAGYTMRFINGAEPLLRYSEKSFRQAGITNGITTAVLCDLRQTVEDLHEHKDRIVIGDFNDLNVLVLNSSAYIIDADSFQFGSFLCRMFTARFVDPLLCDPNASSPMLIKPHTSDSDWYAFSVILMQCLLFVNPYGGVYVPKNPKKKITQDGRALHRITIFNPEVRYPKPAIPYKVLPDDLLDYFQRVFEKDLRGEFPQKLLGGLQWTRCLNCGLEHARAVCPDCAIAPAAAVKEVMIMRGKVVATKTFQTKGVILFATVQEKNLKWLYHENDELRREDGKLVASGKLDPQIRYRLKGTSTLLGKGNQLITLTPDKPLDNFPVDSFGNLPIFDVNESFRYWLQSNGSLMRDGEFGPEFIGNVLPGQTLFWVGSTFGFGFYRAGNLNIAFVFDAFRKGINDNVKLPPLRGQLIDSACSFTSERCWFFVSTQEGANIINQCIVIRRDGVIEAAAKVKSGDGSWLATLRGKCALANFLFATSDEGIVRLETQNDQIIQTREFPDTEPFVDAGSHIFAGKEVLYVVGAQEIKTLKIN